MSFMNDPLQIIPFVVGTSNWTDLLLNLSVPERRMLNPENFRGVLPSDIQTTMMCGRYQNSVALYINENNCFYN
jgi:hypothetical protein